MVKHGNTGIKLEFSEDKVTAQGGLGIGFSEIYSALRVKESINKHCPKPGSNRGYNPDVFITSILSLLMGGGDSIDDIRRIRSDETLKGLLDIHTVPTPQAIGHWLRGTGDSIERFNGLGAVSQDINNQVINHHGQKEYTLDIDAMEIVSEKATAKITYKYNNGYMPMLGFLRELPLCIGEEFREGNDAPQSRNFEFLRYCKTYMPQGSRITKFCADSAAYQASVINECNMAEYPITFFISASLDTAVKRGIADIVEKQWEPVLNKKGEETGREVAETIHCMNQTKESFRLIIQRWKTTSKGVNPDQTTLFELGGYHYHIIATNSDWDAEKVIAFYNLRGQAENLNKETKYGFSLNKMPCGQFEANKVWFRLGIIAYNLVIALKHIALPESWRSKTVKTIRWQLFQVASKWLYHSRQWTLKLFGIDSSIMSVLKQIQERCYHFKWSSA